MTPLMSRREALTMPLWRRELVLRERGLNPLQPTYCIVWEDPENLDDPLKVTTPGPVWLAMALHGDVLPPVSVYPLALDERGFVLPGHGLHDDVIPAMTEREAMEYLVKKDVPVRVWAEDQSNRARLKICKQTMLPITRLYRNAWRLAA